jgi:geranylgeranyl diphosphate synthase type II
MIRLKTAVLLGFSLALGARLAGASATDIARIDRFGQLIGIGFQLKDDLLDVYGNSAKVGKQVGGDIISNKKTFLLLKALENANPSQRQTLDHWLSLTTFDKEAKVKAVREIYDQLAIPVLTQVKIKTYFEDAFALLETLQADASGKTLLRHFTEQLIDREQ